MLENKKLQTVSEVGYILCHECHLMVNSNKEIIATGDHHCPRCSAHLESRLHDSFVKTLALLVTAVLFYIPANIYPIMIVDGITGEVASTIMQGIVLFIAANDYFVGIVIFIASIVVPTVKLVGMLVILFSLKMKKKSFYKHRSLMFRFIQFIGRWSMLDIFVVAIMVSIVNFGTISTIHAGPGATSFGLVVIITMYAAITFDTRLIWDS